jgi:glyoxylase-like metal-dependent hydrolase (beta-lactamase superfamily II)
VIPYVREIAFEYGRVDQVSPLVRRVIANNPGPFTFTGTGTYIVGHGEVAVVDPGPDLTDHLAAILAATTGERITHILVTHHHADHSPLSRPLAAQSGAVVYGRAVAATPVEIDMELEAGYDAFIPDLAVDTGTVLSGPGWTIEAVHTPGHTSNHTCYALREENALFSGDHIMGWSTTVITPPDGDMGDYLMSLDRVRERGFSTLWPTHGAPVTDPDPFIAAYTAHRRDRERQILERLDAGDEMIREIVPVIYAAVDPRLYGAAAHSVLAHMIELVRTGRARCDGTPSLSSHFKPVQRRYWTV